MNLLMKRFNTEDVPELCLRRLAAYVHEQRTRDSAGASHLLGAKPPGQNTDVAPTWMVTEASAHSKAEHQGVDAVDYSLKEGVILA